MRLTDKVYDKMKQIAMVWLPALGALYFALSGIWGFPYGEELIGTITAIDAFLGAVLKISSFHYTKEEGEIADDNEE